MKKFILIALLAAGGCAHKARVEPPKPIATKDYVYYRFNDGSYTIVAKTEKARDEALRKLHLGPYTIERLDMWIVTPVKQ